MKRVLFLLAALAYAGLGSAQSIEADTLPALPPHVYCEITAHHLPTHRNNGVLFDFGQKTEVLKYNYLTDAAGNRLLGRGKQPHPLPAAHRPGPADRGTAHRVAHPAPRGESETRKKPIRQREPSGVLSLFREDLLFRHSFRIFGV